MSIVDLSISYFVKNVFVQIFVFAFLNLSCKVTPIKRISVVITLIFELLKDCQEIVPAVLKCIMYGSCKRGSSSTLNIIMTQLLLPLGS